MKTLCIILARGGSKGLPNKNTRRLAGKPMVAWTIGHAQAAQRPDRVVLSTDSEAIAEIGALCGVEVAIRPDELATDTATVDSAARYTMDWVQQRTGQRFEAVVILYGNVPVRPAGLIDRAIDKLEASGADSVQSVCPVGKSHPYWMQTLTGLRGDTLQPYEANNIYRRQDLPRVYQLDGGVIAVKRDSLFTVVEGQPHAFLGQDRGAVVTQPGQVVDVDTPLDFALAQAILEHGLVGADGGVNPTMRSEIDSAVSPEKMEAP